MAGVAYDAFSEDLKQSLSRQFSGFTSDIYRRKCGKVGIDRVAELDELVEAKRWDELPAVTDREFKKSIGLFNKLKYNVPGVWHVSSSTSGDPSYVWRTRLDESYILDAYTAQYKRATTPKGVDVMVSFSPGMEMLEKLSKRYDLHDGNYTKVQSILPTIAAMNISNKAYVEMVKLNVLKTIYQTKIKKIPRPVLDIKVKDFSKTLEHAAAYNWSVCIGGSVIFIDKIFSQDTKIDFAHVKEVYILTGAGGWDGAKGALQAEPVNKNHFVESVSEALGIPSAAREKQFWDNYGITEKAFACAGQWNKTKNDFVYSTENISPATKVIAVDVLTGELIKQGEGVIRIISPYGNEGAYTTVIQESDLINVLSTNNDGSVKEFMGIRRMSSRSKDGTIGVDKIGCAGHVANVNLK